MAGVHESDDKLKHFTIDRHCFPTQNVDKEPVGVRGDRHLLGACTAIGTLAIRWRVSFLDGSRKVCSAHRCRRVNLRHERGFENHLRRMPFPDTIVDSVLGHIKPDCNAKRQRIFRLFVQDFHQQLVEVGGRILRPPSKAFGLKVPNSQTKVPRRQCRF